MVIDDSQIDLYIAEISIKKSAFAQDVIAKNSGAGALEYLSESSPEELPELIFLDINMPEMNGFEFLDAFEKLPEALHKTCNIMMLSSSLDPEDQNRVKQNKFVSRFVNKPLVREKLNEILSVS